MALMQCTSQCHSREHARDIVAVVTSSVSEEQIIAYIRNHCCRGSHVYDDAGRTALHMAASRGKAGVLEWLIEDKKADQQAKDFESGWTALHRSIFYGQLLCSVKLIQLGSSLKSCDLEDLTPLELAVKDKPPHVEYSPDNPCDVYSWGTNSNFTLGHSNQQSRSMPDVIDEFLRRKLSVKQVSMNKYHTVVLAVNGRVFTCGHGQGGRLGHGNEETCLRPRIVKSLNGTCVFVTAARDHTLFQMEDGSIYGCGQNRFCQLGTFPREDNYLKPRQILPREFAKNDTPCMVAAKYHSVFYTRNKVFTCGLNAGQIGHAKGPKYISAPKLVTSLNHKSMEICHMTASDGVTACSTNNGDIYLLQNYVCRKIVNKQLGICQMVMIGGSLDPGMEEVEVHGKSRTPVVMIVLHKTGKLLSWQSTDETLRRCVSNRKRHIYFTDVALSKQGLLLSTSEGEAFRGHFTQKKTAPLFDSSLLNTETGATRQGFIQIGGVEQVDRVKSELINIQHIPCLHRVTRVTCDPQGHNFAVLQNDPKLGLTELPEVGPSRFSDDLRRLYSEGSHEDSIHDVEIKVGQQTFPAHKLILAGRSDYFRKQILHLTTNKEEDDINLRNIHLNRNIQTINMTKTTNVETMKRILNYIYTSHCDVFDWNFVENVLNRERAVFGQRNANIKETQRDNNKGRKKKKNKNSKEDSLTESCDPEYLPVMSVIKQVKDGAKNLGVSSLFQRLELVKMSGSRLDNFRPVAESLSFNRLKYEELSDIVLQSDDEELFRCHRCILVARLEYFNSMLASVWLEASSMAPLTLPIPSSVLSVLLDFVYTSSTPTLDGSADMEMVCNVLVTADQLLLPRLKEISETLLVDMISLRNVAQLLEFASVYQASQLKVSCQQFIGLNIVYLLESRSLDILSDDVLVELTKAYREMIPGLSSRVITPYSDAPSPSELLHLLEDTSTPNMEEVISSAKSKRKERRKNSDRASQSSDKIRTSVSISESGESRGQTPDMGKVISAAKSRRKERRRSSEKVGRNSETSISEEKSISEAIDEDAESKRCISSPSEKEEGKGYPENGNSNINELEGNREDENGTMRDQGRAIENGQQPRLAELFDKKKAEWEKVGKTEESLTETLKQGEIAQNESSGKGSLPLGNSLAIVDGNSEGLLKKNSRKAIESCIHQEKLPGDGMWLKKGQEVEALRQSTKAPSTTPMKTLHTPLKVTVHPWQSSPPESVHGAGLKDIMAAEMAVLNTSTPGTPNRWSPSPGKKSQSQRKRTSQIKQEIIEPVKTAWGAWHKPATPSSPPPVFLAVSPREEDPPPSSRRISIGDMLESRRDDQRGGKTSTASSSPVSPQSPSQARVWGLPDIAEKKAEPKSLSFTEILEAEKEAKKNLDKALNKSLQSIQIEEQAMDELLQVYQATANHEEYITVEQVKVQMANPHWTKGVA